MATNEVQVDERTYAKAKSLAEKLNVSVGTVVARAIERFMPSEPPLEREIIGSFSDCADLLDEIVEEAYKNREARPLRL